MIQDIFPLTGFTVSWQIDGLAGRQTVTAPMIALAILLAGQDVTGNPRQSLAPLVLWEGEFKLVPGAKVLASN